VLQIHAWFPLNDLERQSNAMPAPCQPCQSVQTHAE
jgi:hypothetical protein